MPLNTLVTVVSNRVAQRLWAFCVERGIVKYDEGSILRDCTRGRPWEEYWSAFVRTFPDRFLWSPRNRKDFFLQMLHTLEPYDDVLEAARDADARTFDLLGTGPRTYPTPLPWDTDITSGARWSNAFYTRVKPVNGVMGDIKMPWELGRFHYLMWLGKGYWSSNSRRFADTFRTFIDEWIDANPMGYGVQWGNAMEVAIRACNWIAGMAYFLEEPTIPAEFWKRFLCTLWRHGEYIEDNLELTRRSGNHLVADYTGLVAIGSIFRDTPAGMRWLAEGTHGLSRELLRQTSADGIDYEQSIAYHRFVAEMAIVAMLLARRANHPLAPDAERRIEAMCAFAMRYTRPDGSVPNIGDNDNGRLFRCTPREDFLSHAGLLATAAVVFRRADFKAAAGQFHQDALWITGAEGWETFRALGDAPAQSSALCAKGGFAVMRHGPVHLTADVGELGKQGWGGHGHNDTLGFELWWNRPLIVDPGTYCYTCDAAARDRFRGTAVHNTPVVDGAEIAEFEGTFRVEEDLTEPHVLSWSTDEARDDLTAEHRAYRRLVDPVIVRRRWRFDKVSTAVRIEDTIVCAAEHRIVTTLTIAPGLGVTIVDREHFVIDGERPVAIALSHPASVVETFYSPAYGVRVPCAAIRIERSARGTAEAWMEFSPAHLPS